MSGIVTGAIHLPAGEVRVVLRTPADHPNMIPAGHYFLHLDVEGGHVTLSGTLEELRQLANTIADRTNGA